MWGELLENTFETTTNSPTFALLCTDLSSDFVMGLAFFGLNEVLRGLLAGPVAASVPGQISVKVSIPGPKTIISKLSEPMVVCVNPVPVVRAIW